VENENIGPAVDLLEKEYANLRLALDWSLSQGQNPQAGTNLASSISQFWQLRGYFSEGLAWLETALRFGSQLSIAGYAEVLSASGFLAQQAGKFDLAKDYIETVLKIYQETGDQGGIGFVKIRLGWFDMQSGDYRLAERMVVEGLSYGEEVESWMRFGVAVFLSGELAYLQGDYNRARRCVEASLSACREAGKVWAVDRRLTRLGQISVQESDPARARTYFDEALQMSLMGGDQWGVMMSLIGIAGLYRSTGFPEQSVALLAAAGAILDRFAGHLWRVDQFEYDAHLGGAKGALSAEAFSQAWSRGMELARQDLAGLVAFARSLVEQRLEVLSPAAPAEASKATANQAAKARFGGLTARERQVAALVAAGKTNQEIASELYVGVRTVEAHITRILTKLNFTSRTQVAVWARDSGLVEPHYS
jgi:non-specific serine/threonine protein kinase